MKRQLSSIWLSPHNKKDDEDFQSYLPTRDQISDSKLASMRTIENENIQPTKKPKTDNYRQLLESVRYVMMIDWKDKTGFVGLPLLPQDFHNDILCGPMTAED